LIIEHQPRSGAQIRVHPRTSAGIGSGYRRLFVPESAPLRNQEVGGSSPPSSICKRRPSPSTSECYSCRFPRRLKTRRYLVEARLGRGWLRVDLYRADSHDANPLLGVRVKGRKREIGKRSAANQLAFKVLVTVDARITAAVWLRVVTADAWVGAPNNSAYVSRTPIPSLVPRDGSWVCM
jgi:hypothetical protein